MDRLAESSHAKLAQSKHEKDEIDYFETELNHIQQLVSIPLMTRREDITKDDPMEELMEVYQDVIEIEQNLQKAVNIASKYNQPFLISSILF